MMLLDESKQGGGEGVFCCCCCCYCCFWIRNGRKEWKQDRVKSILYIGSK